MRFRSVLCLSVMALAMTAPAAASPILFEDFNYPVGPLDGQNGGIGWNGGWVGSSVYDVASGSLSYPGLVNAGNRAQFAPIDESGTNVIRTISTLGPAGSTFWLSFLMRFDGTIGQSIADIRLDDGSGTGYLYIGRIRDDQDLWGVQDTVSSGIVHLSSIPIVSNDTLFVAVRIDLNADPNLNDTVNVYFDPKPALVSSANPGVPGMLFTDQNYSATNTVMALEGGAFPFPTNFIANFDPIRGGTSYFDVAPGISSSVPEPATWGIVAAGLAFLAIAARRRKGR